MAVGSLRIPTAQYRKTSLYGKQDKRSKTVSKNMLTDGEKTGINLSFTQEYHTFA